MHQVAENEILLEDPTLKIQTLELLSRMLS